MIARNKKTLLILCMIFVLFCFVGCGTAAEKEDSTEDAAETSLVSMYTEDGVRYVVDCLGRTVALPDEINKIAAMHIYGVKMIYAMREEDRAAFQLGIGHDFDHFAEVDAGYAALPESPAQGNGNTITEDLISLGVNLVFTNANNGPEEADTYANAGIAAIAVRGETFEEVYETAELMGFIFDKEGRAQELTAFIKEKLEPIESVSAKIKEKDRPRVMVCGSGGVYTAASADMFQNEMIEVAGGTNVSAEIAGSKWAKINAEDVILWDPEYIILSNSCTEQDRQDVLNDNALQTVTAVKNGNVYIFPSSLGWWDFPLPQSMLGIIWTATVIHPELFPETDMLSVADEVYKFMYDYSYTELGGEL